MARVASSTQDDLATICRTLIPGYDPWATAAPGDVFDLEAAQRAVSFCHECLKFIEGEKADEAFLLEPWQQAYLGNLFGWKREDGTRRYRESLFYVPRKNGKTPLCAVIVDYVGFCDNEPGAQIYSAAADREQAALIHRHAAGMVAREPMLAERSKTFRTFKSIEFADCQGIYKALSAEADTKHGLNVHLVIVDELHAHPNGELVDVLKTGTASRRQPLVLYATTADFMRESTCNEVYDYASAVRAGTIEDRAFLPVIYEATLDDDWTSEAVWEKCNPNLDVSVSREYLRRECKRAQEMPSYQNTFMRLHLNIRTEQKDRWLQVEQWDLGGAPFDPGTLAGRACYAGIDLAAKIDMNALSLIFPPDDEGDDWYVLVYFWVPEEIAKKRERRNRGQYMEWARAGFVETTPGDVCDYAFIRRRLRELGDTYRILEVGYDPWGATQTAIQMQDDDGFKMVEVRQGYGSLSEPSKEVERLVVAKKLRHGGNPVLRWNVANAAKKEDPSGNIKPDKSKSTGKIDGLAATITAMARAIHGDGDGKSVYETRGILTL